MLEYNVNLEGKTVLVTGAAGFIGSNLAKRLLEEVKDINVVGIDNMNDYYDVRIKEERLTALNKHDNFVFIKGDISDKQTIDKLFAEYHLNVVVNLAAQAGVRYSITNPDAYVASNLIGFYNILEACRHNEVEHLVYASSSSVYGSNKKVPYSTDDKVDNPVSLYAATKKSNELMAHAYSKLYNIPSTGLRFFTVYGPAGRPDMAYFGFTDKLVKGDTIKIFNYGNCKRDFTYINDVVEGVIRVMQHAPEKKNGEDGLPIPPYKVYNIGNNNPENLLDFVSILQEELVRAGVLPKDYDFGAHKELVPMQPGDVPVTYADTKPLEEDFGFKPSTSLRDGLRHFAEWYAEYNNRYIKRMNQIPPPSKIRLRSTNLELYRIICMLMIVAHHFVVNSGLTTIGSEMMTHPTAANSVYLFLFGMWGKTGINCFLMITGYFMCKSTITLRKFLKLMGQIYLYKIVIFLIFLCIGYETITIKTVIRIISPIWGLYQNFTSCFIVFWLTIPFWNILIHNMTKRQHQLLLCLLLGCYTLLGSVPRFHIDFNYVTWFGIIYLIASYIRLYPNAYFEGTKKWGVLTFLSVTLSMVSVYIMILLKGSDNPYCFVNDSNRVFAVVVAVCSFLWFINMKISYCKIINMIGASTFGVLLIHANSDAMRTWLWKDTVDCVGHYNMTLLNLIVYSLSVVLVIFTVCIVIDRFRIMLFEKPLFKWYVKRFN